MGTGQACLTLGCSCVCHAISAGRRAGSRRRARNEWTPRQNRLVIVHLRDNSTVERIVRALYETEGVTRSRKAVVNKARELGLDWRQGWYTEHEIRLGLGVHSSRVRDWRETGLLSATRHIGLTSGHPTPWWEFKDADVDAFIRAQAGLAFTPQIVKNRRWRALAETAAATHARERARCSEI